MARRIPPCHRCGATFETWREQQEHARLCRRTGAAGGGRDRGRDVPLRTQEWG